MRERGGLRGGPPVQRAAVPVGGGGRQHSPGLRLWHRADGRWQPPPSSRGRQGTGDRCQNARQEAPSGPGGNGFEPACTRRIHRAACGVLRCAPSPPGLPKASKALRSVRGMPAPPLAARCGPGTPWLSRPGWVGPVASSHPPPSGSVSGLGAHPG
jgi:hypothetical protein